jgi:chromate transport protein ChrA
VIVEEKKWLDDEEFLSALSLAAFKLGVIYDRDHR